MFAATKHPVLTKEGESMMVVWAKEEESDKDEFDELDFDEDTDSDLDFGE